MEATSPPLPRRVLALLLFQCLILIAAWRSVWLNKPCRVTITKSSVIESTVDSYNTSCVPYKSLGDIHCLNTLPGLPLNNRHLPLILGIGPAKTSSTALFALMDQHESIVTGWHPNCCGRELYYFSRNFDPNGVDTYASWFNTDKPRAIWAAEKTPEYSDHILAPYRTRALLEKGSVALVYTIRDSLDAYISLFYHRMKERNISGNAANFVKWSRGKIDLYREYEDCVERILTDGAFPSNGASTPSWVGDQDIDQLIYFSCRAQHIKPGFADIIEGIPSLMYSHTFSRWQRVLPEAPSMCVYHTDFLNDSIGETKRVFKKLGLKDIEMKSSQMFHGKTEVSTVPGEEKLLTASDANGAVLKSLTKHLQELKGIFRGQDQFVEKFCENL